MILLQRVLVDERMEIHYWRIGTMKATIWGDYILKYVDNVLENDYREGLERTSISCSFILFQVANPN